MNMDTESDLMSRPGDPAPSEDPHLTTLPHTPVAPTNHSSPPSGTSSEQDRGGTEVGALGSDGSVSPLPSTDQAVAQQKSLNPYPPFAAPASCQVSVIVPSPCDGAPSRPDLECAICFSEFNNVFQCPKMLQCRHTFCLECLARINVKASEPGAVQCPLCRRLTVLPGLGLPKLPTDASVLSYLPAAMQRVYSVRFLRHKGKLEVKRSTECHGRWGQRASRSTDRTLSVGLPMPPVGGRGDGGGVGGALFRLTGRPVCRAFLLTVVVMMMVLLTGIIIFLLTFGKGES